VVPFLKKFEATVRCCTQNGIRGGSATVHFPIWHQEIEDILVLKNNKGTEDNRVRKLDYSIQISKLFYERFIKNEEISLFSPHSVPGLYDAFGTDSFDRLYVDAERNESIPRKTIGAQELFLDLLKERAETGRIYIMNIDHCNSHSSFLDKVSMSNLCMEISLPTTPIQHIDDENGQVATCILSAINVGKLKHFDDMKELCDLSVRALDEIIDYQNYPVKAAENFTKRRRSLGVGYIGLAHFLAKHGVKYEDPTSWKLVHDLSEAFQYYLIQATVNLAKEKGACEYSHRTKYGQGILPIDTYKRDVDEIVPNNLKYDWDSLREQVKQYGVRNSTLSAQMPSESCLFWEHKIKTSEGFVNFHQICENGKIDWKEIESQDLIGWHTLDSPIMVPSLNGDKSVDKIYYNGMREIVTLVMEDGKKIKCTPTHKFLVKDEFENEIWKCACDLTENDDIMEF
jgi:ribonucleoside-diphosphate reductase alpha chain